MALFPNAGVASIACVALSPSDRCAERLDMPVIKVDNLQYPLHPGQNRLGQGEDADVRVGGDAALGIQAIVELTGSSLAVIRRNGQTASVRVNGIALVDPTPLMHGDKVEIAGRELLYADDTKSGNTAFTSAAEIAELVQKRPGPARATTATGGRLVSLVDGKEYTVPASGFVIGRDASATVVVPQDEVSRKHAEIAPVEGGGGYEIRDFSSNGVFVNGARVDGAQVLSRSDVIRIGSEEFRFYADVRPAAPSLEATMAFGVGQTPPPPGPSWKTQPMSAAAMASNHAAAVPPAPPAPGPLAVLAEPPRPAAGDARPVLAVLEITNAGPTKGQAFDVCVPLVHIGRGTHNDIVLNDDSVSETHAKLQRRDDGWYVVDVGSTNGTYVGGQRLSAERKLEGAPDVRFGNVKMIFRAKGAIMEHVAGTRAIASIDRSKFRQATPVSAQVSAPVASTAPATTPTHQGLPAWVWGVVVLAIGAAVAFFLLNR